MLRFNLSVLLLLGLFLAVPTVSAQEAVADGVTVEGIPPDSGPGDACLSPMDLPWVREQVERYLAQKGPYPPVGDPPLLPLYPQAGNWNQDLFQAILVNVNPQPSVNTTDYACGNRTTLNHTGCDTPLRFYDEQNGSVPVYSALDGTVITTVDGNDDADQGGSSTPNMVIIDHGRGRIGYYTRLKNGSILVSGGQFVRAGEQIASVGSSGTESALGAFPMLHFEVQDNGAVIEPHQGGCQTGPGAWVEQPYYVGSLPTVLPDFSFSDIPLPPLPEDPPRTGQIDISAAKLRLWVWCHNLPTNSAWTFDFIDPTGTLFSSWSGNTGGLWWGRMGLQLTTANYINTTGTWTVRVTVNGVQMLDAPLEVNSPGSTTPNRAPVAAIPVIEPAAPNACQPLTCRLGGDPVLDDLDYDLVQYRYEWKVDGTTVRDVTIAARSDSLPSQPSGSTVTVEVTPWDGTDTGSTTSDSVSVLATPLTLNIERDAAPTGEWFTISTCEGAPGKSVFLFAVGVNGVPVFIRLPLSGQRFEADGTWVFTLPGGAPPGISGLVDFMAIGEVPSGKFVASNIDGVQF